MKLDDIAHRALWFTFGAHQFLSQAFRGSHLKIAVDFGYCKVLSKIYNFCKMKKLLHVTTYLDIKKIRNVINLKTF